MHIYVLNTLYVSHFMHKCSKGTREINARGIVNTAVSSRHCRHYATRNLRKVRDTLCTPRVEREEKKGPQFCGFCSLPIQGNLHNKETTERISLSGIFARFKC